MGMLDLPPRFVSHSIGGHNVTLPDGSFYISLAWSLGKDITHRMSVVWAHLPQLHRYGDGRISVDMMVVFYIRSAECFSAYLMLHLEVLKVFTDKPSLRYSVLFHRIRRSRPPAISSYASVLTNAAILIHSFLPIPWWVPSIDRNIAPFPLLMNIEMTERQWTH